MYVQLRRLRAVFISLVVDVGEGVYSRAHIHIISLTSQAPPLSPVGRVDLAGGREPGEKLSPLSSRLPACLCCCSYRCAALLPCSTSSSET